MEPRRIHSALRNRRWLILNATVFLLLGACWWGSHQTYQLVTYRFNNTRIVMEIADGSFYLASKSRGFECMPQPDGLMVDVITPTRPSYALGHSSLGLGGISISFLVAGILFVAIQFLLLPKSLPPGMK